MFSLKTNDWCEPTQIHVTIYTQEGIGVNRLPSSLLLLVPANAFKRKIDELFCTVCRIARVHPMIDKTMSKLSGDTYPDML